MSDEFKPVENGVPFSQVPLSAVQEYWNSRPCNYRHSVAPVGTKEYFDDVEARKYKVEPHIPAFADFAKYKGKRVLEVGCGLGTESLNFARAGAHVTSVDLSDASLELCKKRFEVFGLKADFFSGNAEELASILPAGSQFDLIWSFGVIHHTPHPERCVEQFKKLLVPGGELKLMVYSKVSYKLFFLMRETNDWDFGKMNQLIATYSEAQTGCPVTYTYTFEECHDLLKGFTISHISKDHIFCWDIDEYKKHKYVKEACWKNLPEEQFKKLEKELGWHTLVTAKLA
jgi:2-polyprenyl-3-methyl-5-hydroxy-6-metoxy-1,4-benzoquinol methylase